MTIEELQVENESLKKRIKFLKTEMESLKWFYESVEEFMAEHKKSVNRGHKKQYQGE